MKSSITLLGIFMIIIGIAALGYQGFTYNQQEQVVKIGGLSVTADTEKTVYFPPIVGGLVLVAGVVLVAIGNRKNSG